MFKRIMDTLQRAMKKIFGIAMEGVEHGTPIPQKKHTMCNGGGKTQRGL